jgi:hypothetical protein
MKSLLQFLISSTFVLVAFCASAQTGQAALSKSGHIVLNADQALLSAYELDASSFNFQSSEEALAYFADKQTEMVTYRPVFQNNVVMIYLQIKRQPQWSLNDWNAYLKEHAVLPTTTNHQTAK